MMATALEIYAQSVSSFVEAWIDVMWKTVLIYAVIDHVNGQLMR